MSKIIGLAAKARSGKDTVASIILGMGNVTTYAFADPVKVGCQLLFGLNDDETWDDSIKEIVLKDWGMSPRQFFQSVGTGWFRNANEDHWVLRAKRAMDLAKLTGEEYPLPDDAHIKLAAQAFYGLTDQQALDSSKAATIIPFWGMSPNNMFDFLKSKIQQDFPNFLSIRNNRKIERPTRAVPSISSSDVIVFKDVRYENEAAFVRGAEGQIWHICRDNISSVNAHCSEGGIQFEDGDILIENNGSIEELKVKILEALAH